MYIVNPISGTGSKEGLHNTIGEATRKAGIPFRFFPSVANGDYSFLRDTISDEKFTDIVIVGGDGTVSRVVDSLMDLPVQFGIIPAGSGNGLAFGAGIPKSVNKALKIIFNNHSKWTDGFRINQQFACMLCGIGFDAQVAHDFAASKKRGLITYIKKVFSNFFTAQPYPFKIKLKNKIFSIDAFFISVANSNQFGNHFTIAPKASLSDGLLDIVIVTHQSKIKMLYNTMLQVGGLNTVQYEESIKENKGVIYFQTNELEIGNSNEAPLHIDGEPLPTHRNLKIVIQPSCFQLLCSKENL